MVCNRILKYFLQFHSVPLTASIQFLSKPTDWIYKLWGAPQGRFWMKNVTCHLWSGTHDTWEKTKEGREPPGKISRTSTVLYIIFILCKLLILILIIHCIVFIPSVGWRAQSNLWWVQRKPLDYVNYEQPLLKYTWNKGRLPFVWKNRLFRWGNQMERSFPLETTRWPRRPLTLGTRLLEMFREKKKEILSEVLSFRCCSVLSSQFSYLPEWSKYHCTICFLMKLRRGLCEFAQVFLPRPSRHSVKRSNGIAHSRLVSFSKKSPVPYVGKFWPKIPFKW